jgi:hypothetical protein
MSFVLASTSSTFAASYSMSTETLAGLVALNAG